MNNNNLFIKNILLNLKATYNNDRFSTYSVAYFITNWFILGNINSILYVLNYPVYLDQINFLYLILYTLPIICVLMALFKEINTYLFSFTRAVIIFNILILISFIYAPPRNADSMRVWLAKINDIILNGEKNLRPYAHYNLPDAFTLYHLPVIQIGDGQLFQLCIFTCFCSVLIMLVNIFKYYGNNNILNAGLILFIFNPFITLGATVIITDMPVILAFAGIMFSMVYYKQGSKITSIILLFIFMTFGLNIKYNTIIIIPAVIYWILSNIKINDLRLIGKFQYLVILIAIINSCYPYIVNLIQIGNPVWPALTNVFPSHIPKFDIAANTLTDQFLNDDRSIYNFLLSLFNLLTMPHHINPLVVFLIPFLFRKFKYVSYMPVVIVCTYMMILWFMMPRFAESEKQRYFLYILPIIIPYGLIGFSDYIRGYQNIFSSKLLKSIIIIPTVFYFSFNIYYSIDSFKYLISSDKSAWHEYTWYYEEYDWINNNIVLKDDQQILVYASQQQTNYLKKRYINADPLSGYFKNYTIFKTGSNYLKELQKFNIAYIFIDADTINNKTKSIFDELVNNGYLIDLRQTRVFIGQMRILNKGKYSTTNLYKVNI